MYYDQKKTEVLVIGNGGAGLRAAIEAHDHGAKVCILCKGYIRLSHTRMSGASHQSPVCPDDSVDIYFEDIVKGGGRINNQKLGYILAKDSLKRIYDLEDYGVLWNRDKPEQYWVNTAAGHSRTRKLSSSNEGLEITNTLIQQIYKRQIPFYEHIFAVDLLMDDGRITGVVCLDMMNAKPLIFSAKAIIMATGGAPQLYRVNSGPVCSTGDGLSMALRCGAQMVDMEFFQFIPIAFVYPDSIKGYTLTEPLQYGTRHGDIHGEPGHLYNNLGERFMKKYDPDRMEAATRDVVARSNYLEILEGRGTPEGGVWLKPDPKVLPNFLRRHPMYHKRIKDNYGEKAARFEEPFQVTPSALYTTGGIKIDEECKTNIIGLWAAGEVAGGVHGGNRLGGTSLMDIQVFGAIAGKNAAIYVHENNKQLTHNDGQTSKILETIFDPFSRKSKLRPVQVQDQIKSLMWDCVGLVRNGKGLTEGLEKFRYIQSEIIPQIGVNNKVKVFNREWMEYLEARNMAELAECMALSALERKESRSAHYRQDFPKTDDENWLKNIITQKISGKINLEIHPVISL